MGFSNKAHYSQGFSHSHDTMLGSPKITKKFIINSIISAFIGAVLGIIGSIIVNCTLVEISLSVFFAIYFGILFISVGCVILWRLTGNVTEEAQQRKNQLILFASLIIFSGVLCFILKENWFMKLNFILKIPIYTLLGVSISFAFIFSIVDMVNYVVGFCNLTMNKSLVESKTQVYLILSVALTMGGIFGFIFGIMDIEDESTYQIKLALLKEEHYCYPIGAILGALAGFGNEFIRHKNDSQNRKWQNEFDDEI